MGMIELGELIKNAREDAGLSQEALAARIKELPGRKIDLSKDQISRIESAARKDMLFPAELEAFTVSLGIPQFRLLRALDFEVGPLDDNPPPNPIEPREIVVLRLRDARLDFERLSVLFALIDQWEANDRKKKSGPV